MNAKTVQKPQLRRDIGRFWRNPAIL